MVRNYSSLENGCIHISIIPHTASPFPELNAILTLL